MKKPKLWMLYAAYAAVVIGLSIWQIRSYYGAFEPVQPYTHPGPAAERTLPEESEVPETQRPTHAPKETAVPKATESTEPAATVPAEAEPPVTFPVDLNTADADTLAQIPGIGEVTATAIIAYRDAHGGFRNSEELLEVHGIGEGRYHDLLGYVYLEHEEPLEAPKESHAEPDQPQEPQADPEPTEPPVINLNTATKEQLLQLPGCTEKIADSILQLRDEEIHEFTNILEITMANGKADDKDDDVTEALFMAWEPYLAVDDDGNQAKQEGQP